VDKEHNEPGTPFLSADGDRERAEYDSLREPPYVLNLERRNVVLQTILEVARHRRWKIWACHVRTNHVHIIVTAPDKPEKVMSDFKAYASRRLKERLGEAGDSKRWTQHGSTRYLWSEADVMAKIEYVLTGQGEPLAVHDGRNSQSEPEA
jgi:REP element-mobilizing transposase RayT